MNNIATATEAIKKRPPEQSLLLHGVSWLTYRRLARLFANQTVRFTYDRGVLEIMTTSLGHENWAALIGWLIKILCMELAIPVVNGKSATFRKRTRRRGLEADDCYWIANEAAVRGVDRVDLRRHPPPDLALEVEISRSALNRMAIYATLGVPEVWRFDGMTLSFHILGQDKLYAIASASRSFPLMTAADLMVFLSRRGQTDDTTVAREFRDWVRQKLVGSVSTQP